MKILISKIIWGQVVTCKMWCDRTLATPTLLTLSPYNVRHSCLCDLGDCCQKIFWMRSQSKKGNMAHGLSSCYNIRQDQWRLKFAKVNRKIIICVQIRIWLLKDRLWQEIVIFKNVHLRQTSMYNCLKSIRIYLNSSDLKLVCYCLLVKLTIRKDRMGITLISVILE